MSQKYNLSLVISHTPDMFVKPKKTT